MSTDTGKTILRLLLLLVMAGVTIAMIVMEGKLQKIAAARGTPVKTYEEGLPLLGQVPDFNLTDHSSQPFGVNQLKGKVWIADFIYTRCMGPCPMMSRQMARMQKSLQGMTQILLVSISADPEHDTPRTLREYARNYGADAKQWVFLTGNFDAIQRLARDGFKLSMEKRMPGQKRAENEAGGRDGTRPSRAEEEPIIHSTYFILVDGLGRIRGYYDSLSPQALENLVRDAKNLANAK